MPEHTESASTNGTPESASAVTTRKITNVPENLKGPFSLREKELLEITTPGQNRMLVYGGSGGGMDFADLRELLEEKCQLKLSLGVNTPEGAAGQAIVFDGKELSENPPSTIPIEKALDLFRQAVKQEKYEDARRVYDESVGSYYELLHTNANYCSKERAEDKAWDSYNRAKGISGIDSGLEEEINFQNGLGKDLWDKVMKTWEPRSKAEEAFRAAKPDAQKLYDKMKLLEELRDKAEKALNQAEARAVTPPQAAIPAPIGSAGGQI